MMRSAEGREDAQCSRGLRPTSVRRSENGITGKSSHEGERRRCIP